MSERSERIISTGGREPAAHASNCSPAATERSERIISTGGREPAAPASNCSPAATERSLRSDRRIAVVLGTRPEVMKNWSTVEALQRSGVPHLVLHTNQHEDPALRDDVFGEMGYEPDLVQPEPYRFGRAVDWLMDVVRGERIDLVLVNGDTAAALAGATAAIYSDVELAHVEAGLRSGDPEMREERNRIMVDAAAHHLFAYTDLHARLLAATPHLRGTVHHVGNTTVDLIAAVRHRLRRPLAASYALVTLHRKELTDRPQRLLETLAEIGSLTGQVENVVFPMHPRTRDVLTRMGVDADRLPGILTVPPLGPLESLASIRHADVLLTDSGCMQEEAFLLGTPCVTVRANTERPETLAGQANIVSGFSAGAIRAAALCQLHRGRLPHPPVYGEPGVGQRIIDVLRRPASDAFAPSFVERAS